MPMLIESDRVCVDTNILIYSTFSDFDEQKHHDSLDVLTALISSENKLYVSNQILREFFAIATNDRIFNKPLSPMDASKKIIEFYSNFSLIYELDSTMEILVHLISKYEITKQKIHDFNIMAVMLDNQINHILTYNVKDFTGIEGINVLDFDLILGR